MGDNTKVELVFFLLIFVLHLLRQFKSVAIYNYRCDMQSLDIVWGKKAKSF